jgi:AcrR family transcriptional regulator
LSKPPSSKSKPLQPQAKMRAGRPTAERVEAIDRNILAAAREAFLAFGFEAASMEAIAAAARVSKSTLYSRYAAKDALLRAVVEVQIADWQAERDRDRGPMPSDFKQRLAYHARLLMESLAWDGVRAFDRVLRDATGPARDLARALYETAYRQAIDDLTQEIVLGTHDYPAPPRDPPRVAEMLIAIITGWHTVHDTVMPVTADEAATYAEHAVDVLFAGRSAW